MTVDTDPFPSMTVGLVDARLPKSKGKEKVEFAPVQHILKQSSQPRLKINLFSNVPPTELSGPAIVEPMSNYNDEENGGPIVSHILKKGSQPRLKIDLFSNALPIELSRPAIVVSMSDSSDDENGGLIVLCSNCKARVVLTEPKRQLLPMQMPTPQHQSAITAKPLNEPSKGQRQKVFDMLDPMKQTDGPTSVRRCFDFDALFYEDYYSRNSSSLSSSANPKIFRLPEPRDQRWYSYNSPTGMYTVFSKSQKHRCQRIDCLARQQAAQPVSATKWQPKETARSEDDWPTPTIMVELQWQKETNRDFETTIEASEKRIKLLLRPGGMKVRFEQFKKEAESQLPPLPLKEPLIRVRRNLHPPFLCESLEYMKEFYKKYSANDLYGLPKIYQETLDLALTYPNAEQIIQKNH
ncbi:hypothetical protein ACFX2C_030631 [Malus domestica]